MNAQKYISLSIKRTGLSYYPCEEKKSVNYAFYKRATFNEPAGA